MDFFKGIVQKAGEVVENTVVNRCTLENDTRYPVDIVDHDGTRRLKPGRSEGNHLLPGFSLDLIMKLPEEEVKINFPSSEFQNRTHKMSTMFKEHIRSTEMKVRTAFPKWQFTFNHTGGYEIKLSDRVVTKNSWKTMTEKGNEFEAKASGMIKAIELSASFKTYTKLTRTDAYENEIFRSSERTLKDRCYIWQEVIVVQTNQASPFDELIIPTPHTEMTSTHDEPSKDMLIFNKN